MAEDDFLERLLDLTAGRKRIMVVGKIDTGKSTLIRNLADETGAYVLDADVGQNDIGPPSVVSLGKRVDGDYRAIGGYFCGSTSPSRHFLPIIAGVSRLLGSCGTRRVLINTSGLAAGAIGRALKTEKINAIRPDLIIGLATGDELKYLDAFAKAGCAVVQFRPHPRVTIRSRAQRAEVRKAMFMKHFRAASVSTHSLDAIGVERLLLNNGTVADASGLKAIDPDIVYAETTGDEAFVVSHCSLADPGAIARYLRVGIIHVFRPSDFAGALAGLLDETGALRALGIVDAIDFNSGTIDIFSVALEFTVIQFGSMKLDRGDFSPSGPFGPETLRP